MDALKRIKKDRDHLLREISEAKMKIEVNTQSNESLSQAINRHEKLVKEYNEIIEMVEKEE
ncbi:hypothetical protein [Bacillus sp. ISL-57]|uniref:hypothetical protein n=1 Tax=Bacillus sp. ISL-57 TaxID=2819135 RepID=UPI001BE7D5E8|nr:hypothetical protein [Bacillus sp. ISL-57]MBT2718796.1 hypothetical protein [Bacillus sp. ISL-57]